jgi:DNA-binding IclR family transcriptional regulator
MALLAAFGPMRPVLTLSELAAEADLPVATTHRLAGELTAWGALERRPDGSYQIGMRLYQVGGLAPGSRELLHVAQRILGDLHEATRENVQLAVRDGHRALFLDKLTLREWVSRLTVVGGHLPLHSTAVGKVILAFSEPAVVDAVVAGGLRPHTPRSIVRPGVLADALSRVRREQVAFVRDEMTVGSSSVAAPIFGRDGALVASVGVVVPSNVDLPPLAMAVRTAAMTITRGLTAGP